MRIFNYFLVFLLSICTVIAAPPFIPAVTNDVQYLTIVYPLNYYYPLYENTTLNFDILDSNLTKLTNQNVNCTFTISNSSGVIEEHKNLSYNQNTLNWFTNHYQESLSVHSFYVYCIASNGERGFLRSSFEVTNFGREPSNDTSLLFGILLIPLVIAILLLLFSWMLPEDGFSSLKIGLMLLSLVFIFQSYQSATVSASHIMNFPQIIDVMGDNSYMFTWVYIIIIFVIIIKIIYDSFMLFQSKKPRTGDYDED